MLQRRHLGMKRHCHVKPKPNNCRFVWADTEHHICTGIENSKHFLVFLYQGDVQLAYNLFHFTVGDKHTV